MSTGRVFYAVAVGVLLAGVFPYDWVSGLAFVVVVVGFTADVVGDVRRWHRRRWVRRP